MADVRRVLLCGHRAYAARGLRASLEREGHEVWEFSRGALQRRGHLITGPIAELASNPHLPERIDTVIDYIVLRGEGIGAGVAYARALARLCDDRRAGHLIHISSLSVVRDDVRLVTEASPVKTDPRRSGPYAAAKIAAAAELRRRRPASVCLSLVRPAGVLGADLPDPLDGSALPLGARHLLALGHPYSRRPLVTRDVVNEAVTRLVARPPRTSQEVLLLVDRDSPTLRAYLECCCRVIGGRRRLVAAPFPVWTLPLLLRELGGGVHRYSVPRLRGAVAERWGPRRFDPTCTEERLEMSLSEDWEAVLAEWAATASQRSSLEPVDHAS